MKKEERVKEILNSINAFDKNEYTKAELITELFKLQEEMIELTFNQTHAETGSLKLWDIEKHFDQLSKRNGSVAADQVEEFRKQSKAICSMITAEVSGSKGEKKAFRRLECLDQPCCILKNVELKNEDFRTELDAVVITTNGITIVEVKNTGKNIFIDENGKYYRTGDVLKLDSDIGSKMKNKEELLREVIKGDRFSQLPIMPLVVFTNDRIQVENAYDGFRTCFLDQMNFIISSEKSNCELLAEDIELLRNMIDGARCHEAYPIDIDIESFKNLFAELMATLELASGVWVGEDDGKNLNNDDSDISQSTKMVSKRHGVAGKMATAIAVTATISSALTYIVMKSVR